MDLKATYNRIANDWFADHKDDTWWQEGTNKFLSLLTPGTNILDVGCGAGVKSKYLSNNGFKVTGIDFSENLIEIAKREVPSVDFHVVDIYELEKFEHTFDGVFVQAVLLHIPKDKILEVFKKLKDKLNSNGFFYVAVKETRPNSPDHEILKENDYGYEYERFFSYYTLDEIKEYLEKINLELVWNSIAGSGKTNWVQVIAKKNS